MNREDKLKKLKQRDSVKSMQVFGNGEDFVEILEATVNDLKKSLGAGVELTNLDDLLDQLAVLQTFQKEVKDLREAIKSVKMPEAVNIDGLDDLVKSVKELKDKETIKIEKIDVKPFIDISKKIDKLSDKIVTLKAPEPGQNPSDFVPMRRVMKVGNTLVFDDSFVTGSGGGGSSIPTKNGAVPVVNPDGSNISGGGGSTTTNYAKRVDDVTTTGVTYIGIAAIGSITTDPVWQIKKVDETSTPDTVVITWADGNDNFDNIWGASGDVASLTYS